MRFTTLGTEIRHSSAKHVVKAPGVGIFGGHDASSTFVEVILLLRPFACVRSIVNVKPHATVSAVPGDWIELRCIVLTAGPSPRAEGALPDSECGVRRFRHGWSPKPVQRLWAALKKIC